MPAATPGDGSRSFPLGAAAWIALALLALGVVAQIGPLWDAMRADAGNQAAEMEEARLIERFESMLDVSRLRAEGRSLFDTPIDPNQIAEEEPEPITPAEPTAPTRYGGPRLVAMINGAVWFADGRRLAPGEEDNGLEVVEIAAPWTATLRWRGAEFTETLFERRELVRPADPAPTESEPAAEAAGDPETEGDDA